MKLLVVAGEASGDQHGGALVAQLRRQLPDLELYGIGGMHLLQQGLRPYYMLDALQVHGLVEVVRHLPRLYQILWHLVDSIEQEKPDALLLVDYPGFNLKLAERAHKQGVPVLFYNSPQVWAWRKGRLKKVIAYVDKLVVLFPFELELYQGTRVEADFWGHPLLEQNLLEWDPTQFLQEHHLPLDGLKITLAPGSRPSELKQHLPILLEMVRQWRGPEAIFLLPLAPGLAVDAVVADIAELPIRLLPGKFEECLRSSQAAVVASGTASLQAGLAEIPFVLIYRVAPLSFWLAQRLTQVPFLGMVNILAKKEIIPEVLQDELTPERLNRELIDLLENTTRRHQIQQELRAVREMLGDPGAYERAASGYLSFLQRRGVV